MKLVALLMAFAVTAVAEMASAEPLSADTRVIDTPPAARHVTVEWDPLSAFLKRASFSVEVTPVEHHALTLNGYYFDTTTNPFDATLTDALGKTISVSVGATEYMGGGGELGYRYYSGRRGPRGFFVGPSFLLARVIETPEGGHAAGYWNLGGAIDAGYQALLLDRLVLGVGAGMQYTRTTLAHPDEQLPARVYANNLLLPRLLLAVGCAF